MDGNEQIEIQLSKLKLAGMLLGCIAFVTIGAFFVANPSHFRSLRGSSTTLIFISGAAGIIFFGYIGYYLFKKIGERSPGLIISNKGITDNSGGVSPGFIPWEDVKAIKEKIIARQKFINIVVKNPQFYIDRQKNSLKRKIMQGNLNLYGSAIQISVNGLKITYAELKVLLEKKFKEFGVPS